MPPPDDTAQHILWLTWQWGRGLSNSISQNYWLSPNSTLGQAWTQCWDGEEGPNSWSLHEELLDGECGKIRKLQSGLMVGGGDREEKESWPGLARGSRKEVVLDHPGERNGCAKAQG